MAPSLYSVQSADHRNWETAFWTMVDGATDQFRAKLAMRSALQNASDTSREEMGFWACAHQTFEECYHCAHEYYPQHYRMGANRKMIRIRAK